MSNDSKKTKTNSTDVVPLDVDNYQAQEAEFAQQLTSLDIDLQDFESSLDSMSASLKEIANSADHSVKEHYRRLVKNTLILALLIAIVIIIGLEGYLFYFFLNIISILSLALSAVTVILTFVAFFVIAYSFINEETGKGGAKGSIASGIRSLFSVIQERSDKANRVLRVASILSGKFQRILSTRDMLRDFSKFKDELKFSLERYSLINEKIKIWIDNCNYFDTNSDREYKWLENIANTLSENFLFNNLRVPSEIIALPYLDFKQLSSKELKWNIIISDPTKLSLFCKILINGGLVKFETIRDDEIKQKFLMLELNSIKTGFSLEAVQAETKKLDSLLFKIQNSLEIVSNKIEEFHFKKLESLGVPTSIESVRSYYVKKISSENGKTFEVINILFLDQIDKPGLSTFLNQMTIVKLEEIFSEMKALGILRSSLSDKLLADITRKAISYNHDLSLLKDVIASKEEIIDLSRTARDLLFKYGLECYRDDKIESIIVDSDKYSHLFNIKPKERAELYIELLKIMLFSESLNSNISDTLPHENDKRLMVNSLVILALNLRGSSHDRENVKELSSDKTLVNVLYLFQKRSTEGNQKKFGELLMNCVLQVQEGRLNEVDSNLSYKFGAVLSDTGRITDYNFLLHFDVEANLNQFKKEISQINENKILRDVITSILDRTWDVEEIKDMVLGNAISAYLLTKPQKTGTEKRGTASVMTYLTDKRIAEIQRVAKEKYRPEDLGGNPPESLVMFRDAGTAMRIGVIPSGLSFEEFSDKFDNIITAYLEENGQNFPIHLTRISASESSFYLINSGGGGVDFEKQGILAKIKEIITTDKYIPLDYQLALFTSLRSKDKLTLKDSVNLLLEKDRTLLFEHIAKGQYDTLATTCERKNLSVADFVGIFIRSYKLQKVSQLIRYIVDSVNKEERSAIQKSISAQLIEILGGANSAQYDLEVFSQQLAVNIIDFSLALREFGA